MKGKIDNQGFLSIYRLDENPYYYQLQMCPFTFISNGSPKNCGNWCPHFGEPGEEIVKAEVVGTQGTDNSMATYHTGNYTYETTGNISLSICHEKTLIFSEFKDERKNDN